MDKKLEASKNEVENSRIYKSGIDLAIATAETAIFKKQITRENIVKKIKK